MCETGIDGFGFFMMIAVWIFCHYHYGEKNGKKTEVN